MPITIQYVSGHFSTARWNRFYHQDTPSSLQARRVGDSPIWVRPSTTFLSPLPPVAHAIVRILSGKNASRPFLPRFSAAWMLSSSSSTSINPRRCALLTTGSRSFVHAHLQATMKRRNVVSWWSETRNNADLVSSQENHAVSEESALDFIDKLVLLSGSPSSSLATPKDEGDWMPRQVPEHIPCVPGADVVVHNNGASGAAGFLDIILVDEPYSTPHHP